MISYLVIQPPLPVYIFTREGVEEILNLQPLGSLAKPYQVKQVRMVTALYSQPETESNQEIPELIEANVGVCGATANPREDGLAHNPIMARGEPRPQMGGVLRVNVIIPSSWA
jgi:hypothetical protein